MSTHHVTATPEWVARSLIQIARQPATPDDDAKLERTILNYFQQFYDAGKADKSSADGPAKEWLEAHPDRRVVLTTAAKAGGSTSSRRTRTESRDG